MRINIVFLGLILCLASCKEQEARRPKEHSTTNFYKEVLENSRKLNALEKKRIESYIAKDTINHYNTSGSGFWYTYIAQDTLSNRYPVKGDVVEIEFNVTDVDNTILYNKQQKTYTVDKEEFIPGIQDGIKLMKQGETVTFVIPSYRAYGVTGDGNKIKMNQTIKSTITLIYIKKENNEIK